MERELLESPIKTMKEKRDAYFNNVQAINNRNKRKWLIARGKGAVLDFTDQELKKLKDCFNSLDDDGSGSIGLDELEDPLIGMGFAQNSKEVEQMIQEVDDDGSGQIEFPEFLAIIQNAGADHDVKDEQQHKNIDCYKCGAPKVDKFFRDFVDGRLGDNSVPFQTMVQSIRRNYMNDAIFAEGEPK